MKFSFKTIWIFALILCSLQVGVASERIRNLFEEDAKEVLDVIYKKKMDIADYKEKLDDIDLHLRKTKKGQATYLQFDTIAGSVIIVGVMIGSYKTKFPPGLRAMVAAYTTVTGISHGVIKLSPQYMKIFTHQVKLLTEKINVANKKLDAETAYYCKIYSDHNICL